MKLSVKCSVGGPADGTKELIIRNPDATLSNVRAAIAINFRLGVYSFRMLHSDVDLSDEKKLLRASGIKDGDLLTIVAKRDREDSNLTVEEVEVSNLVSKGVTESQSSIPHSNTAPNSVSDLPAPVTHETTSAPVSELTLPTASNNINDNNNNNPHDEDAPEMDSDGDEEEIELGEGAGELLGHLIATVPNLLEMRQQFLENPTAVMEQIQQNDPHLFELITANQQEFLELVNNDSIVETLQMQQDMTSDEEDDDFADEEMEFDEETEEQVREMLAQYLASGNNPNSGAEIGGLEGIGISSEPNDGNGASEAQRYLEREPTAEEEEKIEQLMQLGFTRDQCKVAFFRAKRSLERAANLLFEDPPQL